MADAFMMDSVAGVPAYTATEARMGIVTPAFFGGTSNPVGSRGGVLNKGVGTELLPQAQSTPNMTIRVHPGQAIIPSVSSSGGTYAFTRETVTNINITAAHATFGRRDRVVLRVRDQGSTHDDTIMVIDGTPSGSPALPSIPSDGNHYLDIGEVVVGANVTSITGANVLDKRVFTVAHGGILPVLSTALPAFPYAGMGIYETDTGIERRYSGSIWEPQSRGGAKVPLGEVAYASFSTNALAIGASYQLLGSVSFSNPSTARKYLCAYHDLISSGNAGGVAKIKFTVASGGSPSEAGTIISGHEYQVPWVDAFNAGGTRVPVIARGTGLPAGTITIGVYAKNSSDSANMRQSAELIITDIGA